MITSLVASTSLGAAGTFVAFAGGSAGGLGVFSNVDYVASLLPHAKVVGVPIGAYVPEIAWYQGVNSQHTFSNALNDLGL